MNISISELNKEEENNLSSFLLQSEQSLLYSSLKFFRFLGKFLNCTSHYLIAKNGHGEILGTLPLMIYKNSHWGSVANSLPYYGSNGGPVIHPALDSDSVQKVLHCLIKEMNKIISENECSAATIISNPMMPQINEWMKLNWEYDFIDNRIGQITKLPEKSENSTEGLMKLFEAPRQRNIRKAMKSGVTCRYSHSREDMLFLFQTHQKNISAIGGKPKEENFFHSVSDFFSETEYRIYIAEYKGKKIAALLLFYYNKTIEYYTPATNEEYRNFQPSSLLIYHAMADALNEGFKYWNWGGTWISQTGVYDFKKKWAARDHPYFYYTKIFNKKILNLSRETLLKEFPGFYVLPFNKLNEK